LVGITYNQKNQKNVTKTVSKIQHGAARQTMIDFLPFATIPHQTRLFLDFLADAPAICRFYPSKIASIADLSNRAVGVLENFSVDRAALCDALWRMNKGWQAPPQTFANIERLREKTAVAVVTGQQAGLFTGALYTVYKAVSVIKTAEILRRTNVNAVPVFWIATEDHDFAEIAETFVLNGSGQLTQIKINAAPENENLPVGKIKFDDSINAAIKDLFAALPRTLEIDNLKKIVRESYEPNRSVGEAFARMMARLFANYGLILLDPLDGDLKKLAAPLFSAAVAKSNEIAAALVARGSELKSSGYHTQILVENNSFPFFYFDADGKRRALQRRENGKIQVKAANLEFEIADLQILAMKNPSALSPNATLRATVQDFLLPTICYFGGAAEIAYFAQTAEVYRILKRPVTPILHRDSFTIVEPNVRRVLEKYNLRVPDFFQNPKALHSKIVENFLNSDAALVFAEAEERINIELNHLDKILISTAPTLSDNLAMRRRKILYHIGALRQKFHRAEIERHEAANRRLANAFAAIFPRGNLQERTINVTSPLARHGTNLIQRLYETADAENTAHKIIFI
jgi:bacillithiol biosynthesis cysteine-adding enzyme BshC